MLGRSPQTRIIDLFLDNPFFEFTRMEMVKALGMAKITLYNTIPLIQQMGIIVPTRKIGKTQLYRLNGDSPVVDNLRDAIQEISFKIAESELEEERMIHLPMMSAAMMAEEESKKLLLADD